MRLVGKEKRVLMQRLFTTIAGRYDWFNRLASCGLDERWRRIAIRHAGIAPGELVLDVCAGTGDLSLRCARAQAGDGTVIGVDFNRAMLGRARHKTAAQDAPRAAFQSPAASLQLPAPSVLWCQGDAQHLPFSDGVFDRVLIGFSTRNLTDLDAGLREMVRVLRPGGVLTILETGYPSAAVVRWGYHVFLSTVARTVGWCLTGTCWPFTYLARSVREFLTPAQMVERLRRVGVSVQYAPLSGGLASLYLVTKAQ